MAAPDLRFLYSLGAKATGFDIAGSDAAAWSVIVLCGGVTVFAWAIAVWWAVQATMAKSAAGRRAKVTMSLLFLVGGAMGFGFRVVMMLTPAWGPFLVGLALTFILVVWMCWQVYSNGLEVHFVTKEEIQKKVDTLRVVAAAAPPAARDDLNRLAHELMDVIRGRA